MENLFYYDLARSVPDEAKKSFNNGKFSGTDINPMWRIKKLTELFGPAGVGWYTEVISERFEDHGDMTIAVVNLNLYVKVNGEWSKPIYGTGGNVVVRKGNVSDEGYKMAYTDALSVACKALGIGADVYFEKDKTKYTAAQAPVEAPAKTTYVCADCKKPVTDYTANNGVTLTAEEIANKSREDFGVYLCCTCFKNRNSANK